MTTTAATPHTPVLPLGWVSWAAVGFGWCLVLGSVGFACRRLGFELRDPVLLVPALGLIGWGWLGLARRAVREGATAWGELVRVGLLLGVALWTVNPFLTAHFVGGIDAKWYLRVLADHVEQARAGVFPVLIGQGPYQFNGAVHPYRFAPAYQNLAALVDLVTGRQFGPVVLQHATAALAAAVSAVGAYFALSAWAPRSRWTAWLVSTALILSPAVLALLSVHDMYMSFLAAAWIPLAFHAARQVAEKRTLLAAAKLSAVLAVILNCHPPVGLWTAGISLGVVVVALAAAGAGWRTLALPLATAGALYALNAFQFQGVAEINPVGGLGMPWRTAVPLILAGASAAAALWATAVWRARRRAGEPDVSGAKVQAPGASGALLARRVNGILLAGVVGAVVLILGRLILPAPSPVADATVAFTKNFWPGILAPVHSPAGPLSDVQPGWVLLGLGVLGLGMAWWVEDAMTKLWTAAGAFLALCLLPFSPFTAAFWGSVPISLIASTSGAVNLRMTPVWVVAMAFAGFGALIWLKTRRPWVFRGLVCLVLVSLGWSVRELRKVHLFSESLRASAEQTQDFLRPENSVLTIYSGNFIGLPPYFSHGVRDYHLESRLLDPSTGEVKPQLALGYAPPAVREHLAFQAEPDTAAPGWLKITPGLTLKPGERLQLTFDFPRSDWTGILVIAGRYFYREYILPSSGSEKAFGSAAGAGRTLVLWSTAPEPEELTFRFRPEPTMADAERPQPFAAVDLREISVDSLPLRTVSLIPFYEAQANVTAPALLESPRTWIPGYTATRNGQAVEPVRSVNGLVAVPLVVGPNTVEIRFVGSRRLQVAFFVSLASWAVFFAAWMAGSGRWRVFSHKAEKTGNTPSF